MAKEIVYEITIDGKTVTQFNSLIIRQLFNAHHQFELVLDQDMLQELGSHSISDAQSYIGVFITICFGQKDAGDNVFKGLVTEVALLQQEGLWGSIVLKGFSPTYLMESGAHYSSFEKVTLKDLLEELTGNVAANDMMVENKPKHTAPIQYTCQYGESHFRFMNRLACDYGEWFFYDGYKLYLGKPSSQDNISLVYGEDIGKMSFSMKVIPCNVSHYSYNSKDNSVLTGKLPKQLDGIGSYTRRALEVSDKLFMNTVQQPVKVRVSSQGDLDAYAKVHKGKFAASTVLLQAEGDNPKVKLGHLITVKVSKKGIGSGYEDHGEYVVTSIVHNLSGTGSYSNSFEAIPSDNQVMPFLVDKPLAENQIAVVKDNNDPEGLGRVKVQMLWQQEQNLTTDWLRVLTPDAGGSDKVSKNRGFVFIPEIGDQVVVGFRYNDPDRPFVLGSMFHGKTGGGGSKDNHSKSLTTRTGSTILLDDKAHTVTMQTSNGNTIKVDEKSGAVLISSGSSVTVNSKNITISGSESVSILSPSITIGTLGGEKPTDSVTIEGKSVTANGEDTLDIMSKVLTIDGTDEYNERGGVFSLNVSEMTVNGGSKIAMSSSDTDIS